MLDDFFDQRFRCRGACRNADAVHLFEPAVVYVAGVGDQVRRDASALAQIAQTIGIRAVVGANDQQQVDSFTQFFYRILAVLGGVADVVFARAFNFWKTETQGVNDSGSVVHGEGCLGHVGQSTGIAYL